MAEFNSFDSRALEDRMVQFAQEGGQVLFFNDFDGTQAIITPHAHQVRMRPEALKAACIFLEMEKQARAQNHKPAVEYAVLGGRSPRFGELRGQLDVIERTVEDVYKDEPGEAKRIKTLFDQHLTGGFYHGMIIRRIQAGEDGAAVVTEGFDHEADYFAEGRAFLGNTRAKVQDILQHSARFESTQGNHPLRIHDTAGGFELNFRNVQHHLDGSLKGYPRNEAGLKELYALKRDIASVMRGALADRSINPETLIDGKTIPLMKEHCEHADQKGDITGSHEEIANMMSIELQPNGRGDKGTALKKLVKERVDEGFARRPVMVVFAGDSITGTDLEAFKVIRTDALRKAGILKPGDEAISIQVLRKEAAEQKSPGNTDPDKQPDYVFNSPTDYSASMLRIAERVQALGKDGPAADAMRGSRKR